MSYTYNGVSLILAKTTHYSVEAEYDPSGTDVLWYKHTIRVRGFMSQFDDVFPGQTVTPHDYDNISARFLSTLKNALETPRRPMSYDMNGETIVEIADGEIDAKLGPHPFPCVVSEVTSGLFMVECGCIVRVIECDDTPCEPTTGSQNVDPNTGDRPGLAPGRARSAVISLRWSQTESFDENWYSRLSTQGKLIVRADFRQSADTFRSLCVPLVLSDYKRVASRYTMSPDGLQLDFQFEDQEEDRLPPFPATSFEGSYAVRSEFPGFKRVGTVHIRLEGQKGTSRKQLMWRACNMAYSKLRSDGFLRDPGGLPTPPIIWGDWREDLRKPVVELSMSALMTNLASPDLIRRKGGLISAFLDKLAAAIKDLVPPGLRGGGTPATDALGRIGISLDDIIAASHGDLTAAARIAAKVRGAGFPGIAEVIATGGDPAKLALLSPAGAAEAAVIAGATAAADLGDGPPFMPSVGKALDGADSNRPGIKPPDRKRIASLLVAAFRDPCACLEPEQVLKYTQQTSEPTFSSNPDMGPTPSPSIMTPFGAATTAAVIATGITTGGSSSGDEEPLVTDLVPYVTHITERTVTHDTGRRMLPGTGAGENADVAKVVTAHGALVYVTDCWTVARFGEPPVLPAAEKDDPNLVFLEGVVVARNVDVTVDSGNVGYTSAGFYRYGVLDPSLLEITAPVAPFYNERVALAALQSNRYYEIAPAVETSSVAVGAPEGSNVFADNFNVDVSPSYPGGISAGGNPGALSDSPQNSNNEAPDAIPPSAPSTGQPVRWYGVVNA